MILKHVDYVSNVLSLKVYFEAWLEIAKSNSQHFEEDDMCSSAVKKNESFRPLIYFKIL